ncbi:MAG: hypothetical protein JST05_05335 [Acidobacteria bacterium]|nr:hypothetical protein [Acidobacteriota bacterium]
MLFMPPAIQQPARHLDAIMEALEALPEAITDRRPSRIPGAARKASLEWSRNGSSLLSQLPSADQPRLQRAMEGIHTKDPRSAALSALDASDLLLQLVPEGRPRELRRADQDGMRAWIGVDAGRWDAIPDLDQSFAWLLAHDEGRHPKALPAVKLELRAFAEGCRSHSQDPARRAAQRLLDLVDALER